MLKKKMNNKIQKARKEGKKYKKLYIRLNL